MDLGQLRFQAETWNHRANAQTGWLQLHRGAHDNTLLLSIGDDDGDVTVLLIPKWCAAIGAALISEAKRLAPPGEGDVTPDWRLGDMRHEESTYNRDHDVSDGGLVQVWRRDHAVTLGLVVRDDVRDEECTIRFDGESAVQAGAQLVAEAHRADWAEE